MNDVTGVTLAHISNNHTRVPHLRDSITVAKVGIAPERDRSSLSKAFAAPPCLHSKTREIEVRRRATARSSTRLRRCFCAGGVTTRGQRL